MLHFTSRVEWKRGDAAGVYEPDGMAREGFVHLSFGHQLSRAATQHARGRTDLVLLVVDPAGLETDVRVEGGFPHLYAPVPVSAVRLVTDLPPAADGSFALPDEARLAELELSGPHSTGEVVERCRQNLAGFSGPWWIGGGWACDAAAGSLSRPHLDVDIAILRPDVLNLGDFVGSWDVRLPGNGQLVEWDGQGFAEQDHQLWLRRDDGHRPPRWQDFAADPTFFEILVEQYDTAQRLWKFRRNPAISDVVERLGVPGGFLNPEVALLYKAKAAVAEDKALQRKAQHDFDHVIATLQEDQRSWLRIALKRAHGEHPWISTLST